jgi:phosphatidylglycerophosphatase GEP4
MVGDRYLTDVVYGNRNGMFTIRPAPLSLHGEPQTVKLVRSWRSICAIETNNIHPRSHLLSQAAVAKGLTTF